ncbi:MAG TPA: TIGR03067 domain-containing protein [Tepidisphaeraceae bacterium]|jgi:uncharacterized protein (TIGR03067 family)
MRIKSIVVLAFVVSLSLAADGDKIDGTWLPAKAELAGKPWPEEVRKVTKLVVKGEDYLVTVGNSPDKGTIKLNPAAKPKEMDLTGVEGPNKGKTFLCIYEQNGDTLRICYDLSGKARPTEFKTTEGTQLFLVTYERAKQ